MAGYSPARNDYLDTPRNLNWLQRWWKKRRDKKAERKKNWMKFLSGMVMSPEERNQFCAFLDAQSTDYILAKPGADQQYLNFCLETNEQTEE